MLTLPRGRLLLSGQVVDILRDDFNASQVDPSKWLEVDTEAKLSEGAGLVTFSGGRASPDHGDPMIETLRSFVRAAGLTVEAKMQADTTNADGPYLGAVDRTPFTGTGWVGLVAFGAAGSVGMWGPNTTAYAVTNAYSASTWYWFRMVALATGVHYFYSADGVAWYRLWNEIVGTTTPLYFMAQTYNQAGSVDYVRLYQGSVPPARLIVASPPAVTPTQGSELLTNGNMETGDPPSSWNALSGATLDGVADERTGGSGAQSLDATRGTENTAVSQAITLAAGNWLRLDSWRKNRTGNAGVGIGTLAGGQTADGFTGYTASTDWTQGTFTRRTTLANPDVNLFVQTSGAGRFDDVSVKQITLSSMLGLLGDPGIKAGVFDQVVTVPANFHGGFACCLTDEADPTYMLYCYTNRTNAVLVKRENDVETKLIDTATSVTYSDGRRLRLVITPVLGSANSSVALFYESSASVFSQIGATQTIDLSLYGSRAATFSSDVSVTFGQFECWGGIGV